MAVLEGLGKRDVPALYAYTLTWLVQIQVGNADWNAVAELPKVEAALERIVALDATYETAIRSFTSVSSIHFGHRHWAESLRRGNGILNRQ